MKRKPVFLFLFGLCVLSGQVGANPQQEDDPFFENSFTTVFFTGEKFILLGREHVSCRAGGKISPDEHGWGTGVIYTSENGKTFTRVFTPKGRYTNFEFMTGAFHENTIVVTGYEFKDPENGNIPFMFRSTDGGINWDEVPGILDDYGTDLVALMEFQNGYFTAVTLSGDIRISRDGIGWERAQMNLQADSLRDYHFVNGAGLLNNKMVVWENGNKLFVGDGNSWKVPEILQLDDDLSFYSYQDLDVLGIYYDEGRYKGYGMIRTHPEPELCTYYEFTSEDGLNWEHTLVDRIAMSVCSPKYIMRNDEVFSIDNRNHSVMRGPSLFRLEAEVYSGKDDIMDIAYGNSTVVIAGYQGMLKYSVDGKTWVGAVLEE